MPELIGSGWKSFIYPNNGDCRPQADFFAPDGGRHFFGWTDRVADQFFRGWDILQKCFSTRTDENLFCTEPVQYSVCGCTNLVCTS